MFHAGISWRVINAKWDAIRQAFAGFDPITVADYGQDDVARLLGDPRVVRSKAKIEAIIDNAQALIELDQEHDGFSNYLKSHGTFKKTVTDLKPQFRFIGDSGAYHFLWSVGEPTPPQQEWFEKRQTRHVPGERRKTPARGSERSGAGKR